MSEHFGRVLWSNYFAARIVVVHYEDDETWWFAVEGRPQILKARTRLSEMPNVKVDRDRT